MCGRTRCTLTDADIVAAVLGGDREASAPSPPPPAQEREEETPAALSLAPSPARLSWTAEARRLYLPSHNLGPTRVTPAVTAVAHRGGEDDKAAMTITVESMVWGVPRSGGGGHGGAASPLLINARAETAWTTATWARALAAGPAGRAVIVANGYYEWKRGGGGASQPHYVSRADGRPLALAALVPPPPTTTDPLRRYAILTTSPPASLAWLHDRAPLILPTGMDVEAWLDPSVPPGPAALAALAGRAAVEAWPPLTAHPVKREMGDVKYQGADCSVDVRASKGSLETFFAKAATTTPVARVKVEKEGGRERGVGQARKKARTLDGFVVKKGG